MFKNLRAEMARHGITEKQVAAGIGMSSKTFYSRMAGRTKFQFKEVLQIRDAFFQGISLNYLFVDLTK